MMLRFSFDLDKEADAIEKAVAKVLKDGYRTIDIMSEGKTQIGTERNGRPDLQDISNRNVNKVTGGKRNMRSDTVTKGKQQAPHRSLI